MKNWILFLLVFVNISLAQDEKRLMKLDSFMNYLSENDKFMGTLTIRQGEEIIYNQAYGYADVEKGKTSNARTKYKIGSVTKTFTATMIMQLVDENKINLKSKLATYFPKVKLSRLITIEDLLYQRTGIQDYLNADSTIVEKIKTGETKEEMLDRIAAYQPIIEPNQKHLYSNSNYYLLGCILEKVTQKTYAENLKERICDRIGLQNTYYKEEPIDVFKGESYSYMYNGEEWVTIPEWHQSLAYAAGGIYSTPEDLTQFIQDLFKGKLVTNSSLNQMKDLKDTYGMALVQFPFGERRFFGHTGGIENFRSVVGYYPKDDLAISLIVNGDNYNRNDIMLGVLSIFYKMPFPFPEFSKLEKEDIQEMIGVYSSKDLPLQIVISEKNGQLIAQATGQPSFPLTYVKDGMFVYPSARIEIEFGVDGFILKQSGAKYRYTKN